MNTTTVVYGLGALILGFVGLVTGDFAMQWQPVPEWVPMRVPLAYLSAAVLLAGAVLTLLPMRASLKAPACLGVFYGLWALLLHLPRALRAPLDVGTWNGVAELTALAMGGIASLALIDAAYSRSAWSTRVFGACLLVFGTAHFVYDDFSATMIPAWLPAPLFWVYLTGCGHLAAGVSLISGVATRLASLLLTGMFACFVLLLHLPRVIAAPTARIEWIMLGISTAMTGAAWIVRCVVSRDPTRIHEGTAQPA
ncbi:putative membrane protein YphA (DoxX/SURF4 family) [Povalibacter uvarum]|uniref:Putative membrane protein YphA (DoxX/SURF4 family) n=1 Tax=Povalibacter uvarum TaxID=732238 RepID=A0A841HT26_9GAMM|nr:DoxX family protein [Povalibacter uvarum]MBB6095370.1 putative membrane protein YphA (DoxX/SURF4 family) [Povalibacter uvarum]